MKKQIAFILASLILLLSCIREGIPTYGATEDECGFFIEQIIAHETKDTAADSDNDCLTLWVHTLLPSQLNGSGEWYAMALSHYAPHLDMSQIATGLNDILSSDKKLSTVTRLKMALALLSCGDFNNPHITAIAADWYGDNGMMDYIFGMHLMNNGYTYGSPSYEELFEKMLAYRHEDGGFSLFGSYGDTDVTAMTLQALAASPILRSENVSQVIDAALDFLSLKQQNDGDYTSFGTANPESTAQVIMALTSLGIDPLNDSRFQKNGNLLDGLLKYHLQDGSFSHIYNGDSNATATVQAFYSLVALQRFYQGEQYFYKWSAPTIAPTGIPNPSDTPLPTARPTATLSPTATPTIAPFATPVPDSPSVPGPSFLSQHGLLMLIATGLILILFLILIFTRKINRRNLIFLGILWILLLLLASYLTITLPATPGQTEEIITVGPGSNDKSPVCQVTLSITCHTIKDKNSDIVPKNGIILAETTVNIMEGATVYDVLSALCMKNNINCDTKLSGTTYVQGINNIYERDFGNLSGWMYFVNAVAPNVDCGSYKLKAGDIIEWKYTTNMGDDLTTK